jgi:hypothetical protein
MKKTKKITILLTAALITLITPASGFAADASPEYTMEALDNTDPSYPGSFYYEISEDGDLTGSFRIENIDPTRSIDLDFVSAVNLYNTVFVPETATIDAGETLDVDFTITAADVVCDQGNGNLLSNLTDFTGNTQSADKEVFAVMGLRVVLDYTMDQSCPEDRLVFLDIDGDGEYETSDGDKAIIMGTAKFYDSSDTLLKTTTLSTTSGQYDLPDGAVDGAPADFYVSIEMGQLIGEDADTDWEGNVFVNRTGTEASPSNSYQIDDISDYADISENIDIRTRNTDQTGTWQLGNISIGPDDKDQIISPSRWDQLVADETFKYADLDHDGRIDPDDKDHVISPLYWDFPN